MPPASTLRKKKGHATENEMQETMLNIAVVYRTNSLLVVALESKEAQTSCPMKALSIVESIVN